MSPGNITTYPPHITNRLLPKVITLQLLLLRHCKKKALKNPASTIGMPYIGNNWSKKVCTAHFITYLKEYLNLLKSLVCQTFKSPTCLSSLQIFYLIHKSHLTFSVITSILLFKGVVTGNCQSLFVREKKTCFQGS